MIAISTALKEARLNAVADFLSIGTDPAKAHIYDGVRPALGGSPAGNLLASIELEDPIGTVANGELTLTPTGEVLIDITGQATWARIVSGNGTLAWDCDVSDLNGAGEVRLPSTTLYAGGLTRIASGTLG